MINKINRLTKKKDIDTVYKQGKSVFTEMLGVKTLANTINQKRFVIIVSTKVSKLATKRNRIKRITRSIITKNLAQLKNGQDYMIIISPGQGIPDQNNIESDLLYALKKLGCIKAATK